MPAAAQLAPPPLVIQFDDCSEEEVAHGQDCAHSQNEQTGEVEQIEFHDRAPVASLPGYLFEQNRGW
jgi:hypothetical protein